MAFIKGYKQSKEHTEKIRQSIIKNGKLMGRISPFKGHKHSKEALETNRLKHLGNTIRRGKGFKTKLSFSLKMGPQYAQWRLAIYERDKFICQKCLKNKDTLNAHHIKSYSTIIAEYNIKTYEEALDCLELWNLDNGITFCFDCHHEFHNKYGQRNNNLQQVLEFIKNV
jgi:hypothetical protein